MPARTTVMSARTTDLPARTTVMPARTSDLRTTENPVQKRKQLTSKILSFLLAFAMIRRALVWRKKLRTS